jgi:hypothetical protein
MDTQLLSRIETARLTGLRDMRHVLSLINLARESRALGDRDLAHLNTATDLVNSAFDLLASSSEAAHAALSVSDLLSRAEHALASVKLDAYDLNLRVADAILLQARVQFYGFAQRAQGA